LAEPPVCQHASFDQIRITFPSSRIEYTSRDRLNTYIYGLGISDLFRAGRLKRRLGLTIKSGWLFSGDLLVFPQPGSGAGHARVEARLTLNPTRFLAHQTASLNELQDAPANQILRRDAAHAAAASDFTLDGGDNMLPPRLWGNSRPFLRYVRIYLEKVTALLTEYFHDYGGPIPPAPLGGGIVGAVPALPADDETGGESPVPPHPAGEETSSAGPVLPQPAGEETSSAGPVLPHPAGEETSSAGPVLPQPAGEETSSAGPVLPHPAHEETGGESSVPLYRTSGLFAFAGDYDAVFIPNWNNWRVDHAEVYWEYNVDFAHGYVNDLAPRLHAIATQTHTTSYPVPRPIPSREAGGVRRRTKLNAVAVTVGLGGEGKKLTVYAKEYERVRFEVSFEGNLRQLLGRAASVARITPSFDSLGSLFERAQETAPWTASADYGPTCRTALSPALPRLRCGWSSQRALRARVQTQDRQAVERPVRERRAHRSVRPRDAQRGSGARKRRRA
jgi:hypothetical protein